ncbi:MAG: hypothetical protein J6A88_03655 [Oscillospiraceae bacterium]|nr:hypothetical protein [Oscillospiraceae bacterium]
MKTKRILTISILALFLLSVLSGCIIIPRYKHFIIDAKTVKSIQIYDLRRVEISYGEYVQTEAPAYIIPNDEKVPFLEDLSNIRFSDAIIITVAAVDPSFFMEWTARINYNDGTFELISCAGYGEIYDENGEAVSGHHYGCEDDEWMDFLAKYVPEDILKETQQD